MAERQKTAAVHSRKKDTKQAALLCEGLSFAASEAYKLLRTNLMFALPNKSCRIFGVTSSIRGEGKSTTSVNLAYTIAQSGKRTLLIDADMRLPSVATKLGIRSKPGLSNLLAALNDEGEAIQVYKNLPNWSILVAGDIPPNPSELLGSERMHSLLDYFSESYDYIILDLPPVNIVSDALVISPWTDGIIMVVRQNYTSKKAVNACMYQVEKIGSKFLGFLMTDSVVGKSSYKRYGKYGSKYGSGYGYGYGYGYDSAGSRGGRTSDKAFVDATMQGKAENPTSSTQDG